jgi:hypothetical protein
MPLAEEIIDAIEELWKAGMTDGQIQRALAARGYSQTRNSIIGLRHRRGWHANAAKGPPPKTPWRRPRSTIHRRSTGAGGVDPSTFRATPPLPPVDEPTPLVEVNLPSAWTLLDLRFNQCHWPVGDNGIRHTYCGERSMEGSEYCQRHHKMGHRPVSGERGLFQSLKNKI